MVARTARATMPLPRRHQASKCGQEAGNDKNADTHPVHMDTRSSRSFRVATDGVDGTSSPVISQEEGREQEDCTSHPNGDGYAKQVLRTKISKRDGQEVDGTPTHAAPLGAG